MELQDAVLRRIEIIGEATKNLPAQIKNKYTEVPWKKISGMRDLIIHEYFGVDLGLAWNVVMIDLPVLKKKIVAIKKNL